jgi:hypothetical protein
LATTPNAARWHRKPYFPRLSNNLISELAIWDWWGAEIALLARRDQNCRKRTILGKRRRDATALRRRATVVDFAQRLLGHPFGADQMLKETLVTFTESECASLTRGVNRGVAVG